MSSSNEFSELTADGDEKPVGQQELRDLSSKRSYKMVSAEH